MITEELYNKGMRCKGICSVCNENFNNCFQYIKDIKGTKFDKLHKSEPKKIKIECTEEEKWFIKNLGGDIDTCQSCIFLDKCSKYNHCNEVYDNEIEWTIIK